MTGRQEYDRTKDRQRILGKYMIDRIDTNTIDCQGSGSRSPIQYVPGVLGVLFLAFNKVTEAGEEQA